MPISNTLSAVWLFNYLILLNFTFLVVARHRPQRPASALGTLCHDISSEQPEVIIILNSQHNSRWIKQQPTSEITCWFKFDQRGVLLSPSIFYPTTQLPVCVAPRFPLIVVPLLSSPLLCWHVLWLLHFPHFVFPHVDEVRTVCSSAVEVLTDQLWSLLPSLPASPSVIAIVLWGLVFFCGEQGGESI